MSEVFTRSQRLLSAADYRQVFRAPDVKSGQAQVLLLARRNSLNHHRLGLAIAKKHIASAVHRNLFKRLAREQFRRLPMKAQHQGDGCAMLDIVVLSRPAASCADRSNLGNALDVQFLRLFKRANAR